LGPKAVGPCKKFWEYEIFQRRGCPPSTWETADLNVYEMVGAYGAFA